MLIVVTAKKKQGEWRGALIVDNEFQDAFIVPCLSTLLIGALEPVFSAEYPVGTEINVVVTIKELPMMAGKETSGSVKTA